MDNTDDREVPVIPIRIIQGGGGEAVDHLVEEKAPDADLMAQVVQYDQEIGRLLMEIGRLDVQMVDLALRKVPVRERLIQCQRQQQQAAREVMQAARVDPATWVLDLERKVLRRR